MKTIVLILTIVIPFTSCAMGKKSVPIPRKEINKMWRYCEPGEVENFQGKLCNRTCLKKKRKCKTKEDFTTITKDPSKKLEDHMFFVNGNHIVITEELFKSR